MHECVIMNPHDNKIYLASKSPRRRELLHQIGVEFELLLLRGADPRGPDVSEAVLPNERPEDYVRRVTLEKAAFANNVASLRRTAMRPVLAADTTVVIDDCILGKPDHADHAKAMLRQLSGRTHRVLTCVAVSSAAGLEHVTQTSEVRFATLDESTIDAYCASGEPFDKAGAYGIQGRAACFIEHISGSYTGIMGLPLFETANLLRHAGIRNV